jgi:hypothetical protein
MKETARAGLSPGRPKPPGPTLARVPFPLRQVLRTGGRNAAGDANAAGRRCSEGYEASAFFLSASNSSCVIAPLSSSDFALAICAAGSAGLDATSLT